MDMKVIEYVVFFGMLLFMVIAGLRYKPEPQQEPKYTPDYWKCESPIERRVYNGLTQNNMHPVSQYPVGKYRIDLAFPGSKIAIECDGKAYHSSPEQKAHDRRKDMYLRSKGWTVLRFSGSKIHKDLPGVIRKVESHL